MGKYATKCLGVLVMLLTHLDIFEQAFSTKIDV